MRHVTKRAVPSMWFWLAYTVLFFVFLDVKSFLTGFERLLAFGCWALLFILVYYVFLHGDVILSEEGVELTNIVRRKKIPWTDIIQAVSMHTGKERILILVRKNSRHIKPGTISPYQKWEYRNAIYLPDDEATREFLLKHFGPVELEL